MKRQDRNVSMPRTCRIAFFAALVLACLIGTVSAAEVTLGPGETLNWPAGLTSSDTLVASGGTIAFSAGRSVVSNVIELTGPVSVTYASGADVWFAATIKKSDASGQLTLPGTASLGGLDAWVYAFVDEGAISFADSAPVGSKLVLTNFVSMVKLPEDLGFPVSIAPNTAFNFYGGNMTVAASYEVPTSTIVRVTRGDTFGASTALRVPTGSTLNFRKMSFDPETRKGSAAWSSLTVPWDITLDGGEMILYFPAYFMHGAISGVGSIFLECGTQYRAFYDDATVPSSFLKYFYGDLSGLSSSTTFTIEPLDSQTIRGIQSGARIASDFAGTVVMQAFSRSTNFTSFGFATENTSAGGTGYTNETWRLGALQGGSQAWDDGNMASRYQFNAMQNVTIGRASGKFAIVATTATGERGNSDDMTIENVADNTEIWVKNGLRLTLGTVGSGVKIHYMSAQVSTNVLAIQNCAHDLTVEGVPNNAVIRLGICHVLPMGSVGKGVKVIYAGTQASTTALTVPSGTLRGIEFADSAAGSTMQLHADVDVVTGPGTVVVTGGVSHVGSLAVETAMRVAAGGTVVFPGGELLGDLPALWMDASNLASFDPLYLAGYQSGYYDPSYMLGAERPANVYTNGFPLVEKWYDTRGYNANDDYRKKYFWQDRWGDHSASQLATSGKSGFYPQFYPYLVPNGLNGRTYLSCGIHGTANLTAAWGQYGDPTKSNTHNERRAMLLMEGLSVGHAAYVHTCVVVYGSEHGGGRGVFGGFGGSGWCPAPGGDNPACSDRFNRSGSSYSVDNYIIHSGGWTGTSWRNGAEIDPQATSMSGGWDVLAFRPDDRQPFRAIGTTQSGNLVDYAGGQDYAEIIVYTNKLTDAQVMNLQLHLANKWGLTAKLPASATITVEEGGRVEGMWRPNLSGSGTVAVTDGATLDASFTGKVDGSAVFRSTATTGVPGVETTFSGSLVSASSALTFGFANGAVTNACVAANAALAFPDTASATIVFAERPEVGSYTLVEGASLSGLTDVSVTVTGNKGSRAFSLVRTANALVLDVSPGGTKIVVR